MKKGDKVKVLSGPHKSQLGRISVILDDLYYVRLEGDSMEFYCKKNSLAKVQEA